MYICVKFWIVLFVLPLSLHGLEFTGRSQQICQTNRTHYIAAVVEYQPEGSPWESTAKEIIAMNLQQYKIHISLASENNVDIIVFPEYGLTTLGIPRDRDAAKPFLLSVPGIGNNPCDDKLGSEEIIELSCAAKISAIYVVVNLGEIRECIPKIESCPIDEVLHFNTNVAFNRCGTIVAKYEKAHLYFEDQFDKPDPVQLSTFQTDFGVEFGLFTCFDIIFFNPAANLVEQGITNFIFPTAWVDELPFLTAIQAQASWAYSASANLLASGYHQPLGGQLGSGIYSGIDGALVYTFDSDSGTKMITAEVPIIPRTNLRPSEIVTVQESKSNIKAYHSFLREDLTNYTSKILDMTSAGDKICTENEFCCEIEFKLRNTTQQPITSENYRLLAFNGTRTVAAKTSQYDWQVCAIVRCLNQTLESCSENDKESSDLNLPNFQQIRLTAAFDIVNGTRVLPSFNALDVKFDLISPNHFIIESSLSQRFMRISSDSLNDITIKTIAIINKLY